MINGISGSAGYGYYIGNSYPRTNDSTAAGNPMTKPDGSTGTDPTGKVESSGECQTCKNRKYQDGSDENVSFKAPAHISPQSAPGAVRAHEGEHVANAYSKASQNNGKVINASVRIHTAVCPECGRTYVSGGVTNTTIKYSNEDSPYVKQLKEAREEMQKGRTIDLVA